MPFEVTCPHHGRTTALPIQGARVLSRNEWPADVKTLPKACTKCIAETMRPFTRTCFACLEYGRFLVSRLTPEQQEANDAWAASFRGPDGQPIYHTGHCPHLELPTYACAEHADSPGVTKIAELKVHTETPGGEA